MLEILFGQCYIHSKSFLRERSFYPDALENCMTRPRMITTFGILSILFGVFGIVTSITTGLHILDLGVHQALSHLAPQYSDSFLLLFSVLHSIASVVLMSAGVGLLHMRPWARKAAVVCSVYGVAVSFVGLTDTFMFRIAPFLARWQTLLIPEIVAITLATFGAIITTGILFMFPGMLLFFMRKKSTIEAFSGRCQDAPQGRPFSVQDVLPDLNEEKGHQKA